MAILEGRELVSRIAAADRAQAEIFARLGRQSRGGTAVAVEHGVHFSTRIPSRNMNGLFMTSPPRDPDLAVRALLEFAAQRGAPWSLTGRAELIEALKEVATAAGLKEYDSDVGMILDSLDCDEPPLPTGLVIERAEDLAGIQRCFLTIARGYEIPAAALVPLLCIRTVDAFLVDPPMAFFIGYVDGKPAAASAGIAWEGVSYVFMVGTVPEFRRRGIGAAMTWKVVLQGRERGCTTSFLRSTQMGLPVYKKMGYREVNRYPSMTKPLVKGRKKVALILRFLWSNLWLAFVGPKLKDLDANLTVA